MTVTSHPVLCTPSHVYTQPCSPWTHPDPTRSTPGPSHLLSLPSRALCSICDAYVSAHDTMLLPSNSRELCWPITNTHDQLQITELAPKLAWASTTPRTCVHARTLSPLLYNKFLFFICNHFGFSSSRFDICTLVLLFTFSLLIPGPTHPRHPTLSSVVASYCTRLAWTPGLIALHSRLCI